MMRMVTRRQHCQYVLLPVHLKENGKSYVSPILLMMMMTRREYCRCQSANAYDDGANANDNANTNADYKAVVLPLSVC